MTDNEMRIATAEECGWKFRIVEARPKLLPLTSATPERRIWIHPNGNNIEEFYAPNYPSDLNAMHEARRLRINTLELRVEFLTFLRSIVGRKLPKNKSGYAIVSDWDVLDATAHELDEAFLRVKGKWKDS